MPPFLDLTGQKFSRWTVIGFSHIENKRTYWFCRCECGEEKIVRTDNLRSGTTQSCGCLRKEIFLETKLIDLTGKKFNNIIVLQLAYKDKNRKYYWHCRCDCGNEKIIIGNNLKNGHTKSCGCLLIERVSGKNNVNWKDGASKEIYPKEWTEKLKESIRNRDQRRCQFQDCQYDDTKETRKLSVHHIDGEKNNCEPYNLVSLCLSHHMEIERKNPSLWIDYFYQITGDYR